MKELENKVALVSSSTRGIGLACAKTLAAQGAAVYLGVRRLEAGQQIADELIAAGGRAGVVFFDASREESFSGMVDEVAAKEGRLDILVNNFLLSTRCRLKPCNPESLAARRTKPALP